MNSADKGPPPYAAAPGQGNFGRAAARLGWGHHGYHGGARRNWILAAVLFLPFLNDMQMAVRRGFDRDARGLPAAYGDLKIFYDTARAFAADPNGPIYSARPEYLYPPFFLTLFVPLLWLPPHGAVLVFELLKWVALWLALRTAWRLAAPPEEDLPPIVLIGALLLAWRYFVNEMLNGNVNMFMLAGVLAAAQGARSRWFFAAGLLAALLACVKLTPALLLVFFAWKRWWSALAGAAAGLLIGLVAWPGVLLGWERNLVLLHDWYDHVLHGYVAAGAVYSVGANQGLAAWLNRLFTDSIAIEPDTRVTLVELPPALLSGIRWALAALIGGALLWAWRRRTSKPAEPLRSLEFAAEIGLAQIAMLVLSGYTWKAHYVAMLLPYTVQLAFLADGRGPKTHRRATTAWLVISVLLMLASSEFAGPRVADLLMCYGVLLGSSLAAAAGLLTILRVVRRAPAAPLAVQAD